MIRTALSNLLVAATLTATVTLASAQTPRPIDPQAPTISMNDARRIAMDNGMVRVEDIELDDGIWEVDGRDSVGAEMELDLRASDGMVVRLERDRPASATAKP